MEEVSDEEIDKNIGWAMRWGFPVAEVLRLLKEERARLKAEVARLSEGKDG